jgi:hypothetical protein
MLNDIQAFLRHKFVSDEFLRANNLTRGAIVHDAARQVSEVVQAGIAENNRKRDCIWTVLCGIVAGVVFLLCYFLG